MPTNAHPYRAGTVNPRNLFCEMKALYGTLSQVPYNIGTYIPCVPCVWVLVACGPVATPFHSWSLSARQWESLRQEWEGTPTDRGGCSIYEASWTLKSSWYPSQRVQPCVKRQCTMVVNSVQSNCSLWDKSIIKSTQALKSSSFHCM